MQIGDRITIKKGEVFTAPERGDYEAFIIVSGEIKIRYVTSNRIYLNTFKLENGYVLPLPIRMRLDKGDTVRLEYWVDYRWRSYSDFTVTALALYPSQPLFEAYKSSTVDNAPGDGVYYQYNFIAEEYEARDRDTHGKLY